LAKFARMKRHIGRLIKDKVKSSKFSVTEFAREINCSRRNVYTIFERESVDTELLKHISAVLDYNFFQYYIPQLDKEPMHEPSIEDDYQKITELEKENKYLKEINQLLKDKLKKK